MALVSTLLNFFINIVTDVLLDPARQACQGQTLSLICTEAATKQSETFVPGKIFHARLILAKKAAVNLNGALGNAPPYVESVTSNISPRPNVVKLSATVIHECS